MNLAEFKAWFEGYTENLSGPPNKAQWARIQERIAEIQEEPTPAPVIIHELQRYWPEWPRRGWRIDEITCGGTGSPLPDRGQWICNNGADAFMAIGRAEFSA